MNRHLLYSAVISAGLLCSACSGNHKAIYESNAYSIFPDRVIQGEFEAVALSPYEISSNYRSPESLSYSPTLQFKFSINSRDNEMPSGKDHKITLQPVDGKVITTAEFGQQLIQTKTLKENDNLPENTEWTVRLDLRKMKYDFEKQGFFTLFNGEKLNKQDFKGVYIAGSAAPLSWDFSNLYTRNDLELKDPDGKAFIREIAEKAKTQNNFSVDYKFTDPVTKKVLPKTIFCEKLNDTTVCSGVYKR